MWTSLKDSPGSSVPWWVGFDLCCNCIALLPLLHPALFTPSFPPPPWGCFWEHFPRNFLSGNLSQSLYLEHPTQDSVTCRMLKFLSAGPVEMSNTNVHHSCIHTYYLLIEDLLHVKLLCVFFRIFQNAPFSSWNEAQLLNKSQTFYNLLAAVRFFWLSVTNQCQLAGNFL